jgi:hypothetical protein
MIKEVDEAILGSLKKGLLDIVPSENIIIGEKDQKKDKSIFLINTGFTVEELGIGGSGGVIREEIVEKLDSDGKKKDFILSQKPLKPLIGVESTIGLMKNEPDDYTVDYLKGIVSFRVPPEIGKESVKIMYNVVRPMAETRNLKFILAYSIYVRGENMQNRDDIMLEIIKVLYREKGALAKKGVEELRLIKGYTTQKTEGQNTHEGIIEYQIETILKIETPLPSIEKIEIGRFK